MLPPFWKDPEIAEFGAADAIHTIELRGVHELADFFDMLDGKDYDDLKDSILTQGLIDPIVISQDGVLLDGRNRLRACLETNTPRTYRLWMGAPDKLVMAKNLVRRHLTVGQKAALAAKLYDWHKSQPGHAEGQLTPTLGGMAKALGISPESVKRARKLQRDDPEAFEQVQSGERRRLPNLYDRKRLQKGEVMLAVPLPLTAFDAVKAAAEHERLSLERWAAECLTAAAVADQEMREAID